MSKDKYPCIFLKANGGYCVYYPSNIFTRGLHFGRPFLKTFKRQSNSIGPQNIFSLFKVFTFIHFKNLLRMKTKRANVNREVRKLGPEYHLGNIICCYTSAVSLALKTILIG